MQIIIWCLLALAGFSFGLLAAAGVFTVLSAVGLIPRFAGKTHSAKEIWLYEDMVTVGTIVGCIFSIFQRYLQIGAWLDRRLPGLDWLWEGLGQGFLGISGLFYGMFVGCLALAIAEMLNSLPARAGLRRTGHGDRKTLRLLVLLLAGAAQGDGRLMRNS